MSYAAMKKRAESTLVNYHNEGRACVEARDVLALLAEIERKDAALRKADDALDRVGNRRMWRHINGELAWIGDDGNVIETRDPVDILQRAKLKVRAALVPLPVKDGPR